MPRTVDALEARRRLGALLDEARIGKRATIVLRSDRPMAAIVPIEFYEALTSVPDKDIELYTNKRVKEFLSADTIK